MKREREEEDVQAGPKRRSERASDDQLEQPAASAVAAEAAAAAPVPPAAAAGAGELEPPISVLPRDLLPRIFSLLDLRERCRARRVCRAWRAAALEPPHSTTLTVALRCRALPAKPQGAAEEATSAGDPPARAELRFLRRLRAALASPLGAGLQNVRLTLVGELVARMRRRWPLAEALRALPASVTALALGASIARPKPAPPQRLTAAEEAGLRSIRTLHVLQEALPGLLELEVCDELTRYVLWEHPEKLQPLDANVHAGLQRLDVGLGIPPVLGTSPPYFATQLPALTRLHRMFVDRRTSSRELLLLARRGFKVRSLLAERIELRDAAAAEALADIFRPVDFDWPRAEPSVLRVDLLIPPPSGLPVGFGAGVQQIQLGHVYPGLLPWLAEIVSNPALKEISFDPYHVKGGAHPVRLTGMGGFEVPAVQLLESLRNCHEDFEVTIEWPARNDKWGVEALAPAVALVLGEPRLLKAVRLRLGGLLHRLESFVIGADLQATPGPESRDPTPCILAAEWISARCEAAAGRRPLLEWEAADLANHARRLEAKLRHCDAPQGERAGRALGRCRALQGGALAV